MFSGGRRRNSVEEGGRRWMGRRRVGQEIWAGVVCVALDGRCLISIDCAQRPFRPQHYTLNHSIGSFDRRTFGPLGQRMQICKALLCLHPRPFLRIQMFSFLSAAAFFVSMYGDGYGMDMMEIYISFSISHFLHIRNPIPNHKNFSWNTTTNYWIYHLRRAQKS